MAAIFGHKKLGKFVSVTCPKLVFENIMLVQSYIFSSTYRKNNKSFCLLCLNSTQNTAKLISVFLHEVLQTKWTAMVIIAKLLVFESQLQNP